MAKIANYVSPIGTAAHPHLTVADEYEGTLKFKTMLVVEDHELEAAEALCVKLLEESGSKVRKPNLPIKELKDGTRALTTSSKFLPLIVDSQMKPILDPKKLEKMTAKQAQAAIDAVEIWAGTRLRFSATPYVYAKGISFQLNSVQIIDLVNGNGRSQSSAGFGVVDGYTAEDDAADEPVDTSDFEDTENGADLDI